MGNANAPAGWAAFPEGDPTGEFTATGMTGWTGCNSYRATYSVRESELRLDGLMWTEIGCPTQELFRQEQQMQGALAAVERFEISGDQLALRSEGGQVLIFKQAEDRSPQPLLPRTIGA